MLTKRLKCFSIYFKIIPLPKITFSIHLYTGPLYSVLYSPNGDLIAVGSTNNIHNIVSDTTRSYSFSCILYLAIIRQITKWTYKSSSIWLAESMYQRSSVSMWQFELATYFTPQVDLAPTFEPPIRVFTWFCVRIWPQNFINISIGVNANACLKFLIIFIITYFKEKLSIRDVNSGISLAETAEKPVTYF